MLHKVPLVAEFLSALVPLALLNGPGRRGNGGAGICIVVGQQLVDLGIDIHAEGLCEGAGGVSDLTNYNG